MEEQSPEEIDSLRQLEEVLNKENWTKCSKCNAWVVDGELGICDRYLTCPMTRE